MTFDEFFKMVVGDAPFPFQRRFAESPDIQLVHVPTGLGKTAMAVVGWLWKRFAANANLRAATPRRLVYCLPMRVLVEQTAGKARQWIAKLKATNVLATEEPQVHVLMGGEAEDEWDIHPEREAIIVGTQDMLLSRALNRGYAASRSRWPIQFGMLHTDCLWIFDEIQLMGSGLATTAQLEAFRRKLPREDAEQAMNSHGCRSVWMSATLQKEWLQTVDFKDVLESLPPEARLGFEFAEELKDPRLDEAATVTLEKRRDALKPLTQADAAIADVEALAAEILGVHLDACEKAKAATRTIVVVNTVKRACSLFEALETIANGAPAAKKGGRRRRIQIVQTDKPKPAIVLLHSRFRPGDRAKAAEKALGDPPPGGMMIVSTQVIEAGVDVSAATLFTELAPWASLVQRFGRCNRRGEQNEYASVHWINVPDEGAAPYDAKDFDTSREHLQAITRESEQGGDVGLRSLPAVLLKYEHTHVIRRKDLFDLFDTTPDLAGSDIDIDRFVREIEDSDVRVFWRIWDQPNGGEPPSDDEAAARREELCPVAVGEFRAFAKEHPGQVWRWNFLDEEWEKAEVGSIAPGQVFLVHGDAGGYSAERGWDGSIESRVDTLAPKGEAKRKAPDGTEDERLSRIGVWQTVAEHTGEVRSELEVILNALSAKEPEREALRRAAQWHDRGKAHEVFKAALPDGVPDTAKIWAKAAGRWKRYGRPRFRHELASALAVLLSPDGLITAEHRDLIAYLVAAHHGKVRLSIRSLAGESRPGEGTRFARGIWEGDGLPETDLGNGILAPAVELSLDLMELGLSEKGPFRGQRSWIERMINLRDTLGPFRLAYLETILRSADIRASKSAENRRADATFGRKEVVCG